MPVCRFQRRDVATDTLTLFHWNCIDNLCIVEYYSRSVLFNMVPLWCQGLRSWYRTDCSASQVPARFVRDDGVSIMQVDVEVFHVVAHDHT